MRGRAASVAVRIAAGLVPALLGIAVCRMWPVMSTDTGETYALFVSLFTVTCFISAIAALISPRRLFIVSALATAPVLFVTWVVAMHTWPGGNDGGGFFWAFVALPGMVLTGCAQYICAAIRLTPRSSPNEAN